MRAFFAIAGLTLRHALRSHIFQLLLLVLLLAVVFIPGTVGAGTASDFIRVTLLYSLSAVSLILALSSLWLGCYTMTHDVDSYQLHMITSKPVSRVTIWCAKWFGVNVINLILLLAASGVIFAIIQYRFARSEFDPAEKEKIRNEVLVGRRVFRATKPDYASQVRERTKQMITRLQSQGVKLELTPEVLEKMQKAAQLEVVSGDSELKAGKVRAWVFENLPEKIDKPIYFRYRPYIDKVATEGQRVTRVQVLAGLPRVVGSNDQKTVFDNDKAGYDVIYNALSAIPEQVKSGEFHEKVLRPEWNIVSPDNKVFVAVFNGDPQGGTQFYQPADGPKLLIQVCGFFNNYMRAVAVIALELLILSGLACAFGGCMSMPTAIFVVVSYLLFGSFAVFMTGLDYLSGTADQVGVFISKLILTVVIPLQAFEATSPVAGGELIEWSRVGYLGLHYFIFRGIPIFLFGIWMYRKRELGLIIRK